MTTSIKNYFNRLSPGSSSVLKKSLIIWGLTVAYPAFFFFLLGICTAYTESTNINFTNAIAAGGLFAILISLYTVFVWGPINSLFLCILWIFNICHIQYTKKWLLFLEPLFFLLLVWIYDQTLYYKVKSFLMYHFPIIFDYEPTFEIYVNSFLSTMIIWSIPILITGLLLWVVQFLYRLSTTPINE